MSQMVAKWRSFKEPWKTNNAEGLRFSFYSPTLFLLEEPNLTFWGPLEKDNGLPTPPCQSPCELEGEYTPVTCSPKACSFGMCMGDLATSLSTRNDKNDTSEGRCVLPIGWSDDVGLSYIGDLFRKVGSFWHSKRGPYFETPPCVSWLESGACSEAIDRG